MASLGTHKVDGHAKKRGIAALGTTDAMMTIDMPKIRLNE
jgi:hypothetical protein